MSKSRVSEGPFLNKKKEKEKEKETDPPSQSSQDDLKAELVEALLEKKAAESSLVEAAEGFFFLALCEPLQQGCLFPLGQDCHQPAEARRKCMQSFQDCMTFHLLDMFPSNAAKQQHF